MAEKKGKGLNPENAESAPLSSAENIRATENARLELIKEKLNTDPAKLTSEEFDLLSRTLEGRTHLQHAVTHHSTTFENILTAKRLTPAEVKKFPRINSSTTQLQALRIALGVLAQGDYDEKEVKDSFDQWQLYFKTLKKQFQALEKGLALDSNDTGEPILVPTGTVPTPTNQEVDTVSPTEVGLPTTEEQLSVVATSESAPEHSEESDEAWRIRMQERVDACERLSRSSTGENLIAKSSLNELLAYQKNRKEILNVLNKPVGDERDPQLLTPEIKAEVEAKLSILEEQVAAAREHGDIASNSRAPFAGEPIPQGIYGQTVDQTIGPSTTIPPQVPGTEAATVTGQVSAPSVDTIDAVPPREPEAKKAWQERAALKRTAEAAEKEFQDAYKKHFEEMGRLGRYGNQIRTFFGQAAELPPELLSLKDKSVAAAGAYSAQLEPALLTRVAREGGRDVRANTNFVGNTFGEKATQSATELIDKKANLYQSMLTKRFILTPVSERESIQIEGLKLNQKGALRKSLEWWGRQSKVTKIATGAVVVVGATLATGGTAALAAGAGTLGARLSFSSLMTATGAGALAGKASRSVADRFTRGSIARNTKNLEIEKKAATEKYTGSAIKDLQEKVSESSAALTRTKRRATFSADAAAIGGGAVVGGVAGGVVENGGIDVFSSAHAAPINTAPDSVHLDVPTPPIAVPSEATPYVTIPGVTLAPPTLEPIASEVSIPVVPLEAHVTPTPVITPTITPTPVPEISITPTSAPEVPVSTHESVSGEVTPTPEPAHAEIIAPEAPASGDYGYVVKGGDNLWNITEAKFEDILDRVPEGHAQDAVIDTVMDKLEADETLRDAVGLQSDDINRILPGTELHLDALKPLIEEAARNYDGVIEPTLPVEPTPTPITPTMPPLGPGPGFHSSEGLEMPSGVPPVSPVPPEVAPTIGFSPIAPLTPVTSETISPEIAPLVGPGEVVRATSPEIPTPGTSGSTSGGEYLPSDLGTGESPRVVTPETKGSELVVADGPVLAGAAAAGAVFSGGLETRPERFSGIAGMAPELIKKRIDDEVESIQGEAPQKPRGLVGRFFNSNTPYDALKQLKVSRLTELLNAPAGVRGDVLRQAHIDEAGFKKWTDALAQYRQQYPNLVQDDMTLEEVVRGVVDRKIKTAPKA